jgi:FAD/FMN-containing dehydrogenase
VAVTRLADRILGFSPERGLIRAEAGLSLERLSAVLWPQGFCPPVLPGTRHVTLGGMVASDVHGKNHHAVGCFGEHVAALRLRTAAGDVLELSETNEPELFRATLGGMGLTGHVLEVELRLERIASPWIWRESRRVRDLAEMIDALAEAGPTWPYTVCWMDATAGGAALGRGVLTLGRWATPDEVRQPRHARLAATVPFSCPRLVVSWPVVKAFNLAYRVAHGSGRRRGVVDPGPFFHPLDALHDWNRLYGRTGFTQYQCVVPFEAAQKSIGALLAAIRAEGLWCPLAVVKDCGSEGRGMLSFPRPGISVALDLPLRWPATERAVRRLNRITNEAGGRIYLAKDALSTAEEYRAMDGRVDAFLAVRRKWDPGAKIRSALSVRLFGDPA